MRKPERHAKRSEVSCPLRCYGINLCNRNLNLMRLLFLFASVMMLATSCNMSDDYHELDSGFNYNSEGGEAHSITGGDIPHNTVIYGNVLSYNSDDNFIIAEQKPSRAEYKSEIGSNLWSDYYRYHDFIADSAEWKRNWPSREVYATRKFGPLYKVLKSRRLSLENSVADKEKSEIIADSLIDNQPYFQNIFQRTHNYWIIDKKSNTGYGPVDSLQFAQQCKRMGISMELEAHY